MYANTSSLLQTNQRHLTVSVLVVLISRSTELSRARASISPRKSIKVIVGVSFIPTSCQGPSKAEGNRVLLSLFNAVTCWSRLVDFFFLKQFRYWSNLTVLYEFNVVVLSISTMDQFLPALLTLVISDNCAPAPKTLFVRHASYPKQCMRSSFSWKSYSKQYSRLTTTVCVLLL
jgi:hypothetical protein